jgi:hypothetical protein
MALTSLVRPRCVNHHTRPDYNANLPSPSDIYVPGQFEQTIICQIYFTFGIHPCLEVLNQSVTLKSLATVDPACIVYYRYSIRRWFMLCHLWQSPMNLDHGNKTIFKLIYYGDFDHLWFYINHLQTMNYGVQQVNKKSHVFINYSWAHNYVKQGAGWPTILVHFLTRVCWTALKY